MKVYEEVKPESSDYGFLMFMILVILGVAALAFVAGRYVEKILMKSKLIMKDSASQTADEPRLRVKAADLTIESIRELLRPSGMSRQGLKSELVSRLERIEPAWKASVS